MLHLNSRLCAVIAAGLSLWAAPGLGAQDASAPPAALRGDVDGDGRVTRADADAVRAYLVRGALPGGRAILPAGDANGDGRVTAADAALISRFAAGVDVSRFPVGRAEGTVRTSMLQSGDQLCTVDVRAGTLACQEVLAGGDAAANVILGPPYVTFVTTTAHSRGSSADEDTTSYTVAIRNATSQPLGTTDGTTRAPDGIRLFFSTAPVVYSVSSGTTVGASMRLETPDGTATFTNQNGSATYTSRPYFQYDTVVAPGDTTDARSMQFIYSSNVTSFSFGYRVSAPAQYEHGRITIAPATLTLAPGQTSTLTGTVYNQVDQVQGDGITWSTSNAAVATVNASTGEVTAVGVGTATITATSTVNAQRTGTRQVTVTNELTWEGDVSSDWHTPQNWSLGVVPDSQSIAIIPAVTNKPVLGADGAVLDIQVASLSTVTLGVGVTLKVYGDVTATGTISGGTLWLTGTSAEVQGTISGARITGSTSLDGATRASAAVSVTGSLTVANQALSITIP